MGHVPQGMGAYYRERISDDRLRRVTDHVRGWLFAETEPGPNASEAARHEAPASETDAPDGESETDRPRLGCIPVPARAFFG